MVWRPAVYPTPAFALAIFEFFVASPQKPMWTTLETNGCAEKMYGSSQNLKSKAQKGWEPDLLRGEGFPGTGTVDKPFRAEPK